MPTLDVAPERIERVAKALCANDYVNGPPLWEPRSIESRWAEQDDERVQHYMNLARHAVEAFVRV